MTRKKCEFNEKINENRDDNKNKLILWSLSIWLAIAKFKLWEKFYLNQHC